MKDKVAVIQEQDVNLTHARALEFKCVRVLKEHAINVKPSFVDGSPTRKKEVLCEITDLRGNTRTDWFIIQDMSDVDVLFGVTFMDGRSTEFNTARGSITVWDWKGCPFEFRMEDRSRRGRRRNQRD